MESAALTIPVRISRSDSHVLLVTPMPGINPADISVTIQGRAVKILGHQTGPGQNDKDLVVEEWTIGPYYREVQLPEAVNGLLTNATFGNGILTLAMPKAHDKESEAAVSFHLQPIDAARGERVGHKGSEINPF
jgi:HSP20 family protein